MQFVQTFSTSLLIAVGLLSFADAHASSMCFLKPGQFDEGERIYVEQCSSCHGVEGRGSEHYDGSLEGDLSVMQLTELIAATMPQDDPQRCVTDAARQVAEFVHQAFYSDAAQLQRTEPRVELHRRTIRQYRQSVSELLGTFSKTQHWNIESRGLTAQYFAWNHHREDRRLAKQIDRQINFPGDAGGVPHFRSDNNYENVKPIKKQNNMGKGFCAYWTGSLMAPTTGTYEFLIKCGNGFKFHLNDPERPLIDRWVRSNNELEHRAKIYLVEGRPYYLRLNVFAYLDPEVTTQLFWRPPGGNLELVPESVLIPSEAGEWVAVSTPFPADDGSHGYERGSTVSRQWEDATTAAAIETASWVAQRIWKLAETQLAHDDCQEKVRQFCRRFTETAFVTRLNDDDFKFYVEQHFENELSIQDQVKRVVLLVLKSPRFLYPQLESRERDFELAQRLAIVLWDSLPDRKLLQTAESGRLKDAATLAVEIERLLHDPRSKSKLKNFFAHWLRLDSIAETSKDKTSFPDFDEQLFIDMRTSLEIQLTEWAWDESADYRQLFLDSHLYANTRLAEFYGLERHEENAVDRFERLAVLPGNYAGLLTHPYLLTGLAYHKDSSPIHRGVFVAKRLLGRRLRQPPEAIEPLSEDFGRQMTTREKIEHQTKETSCMNCHQIINPLGFCLENFDAVGKFRLAEKGKPIVSSSVYQTRQGMQMEFGGARDLARFVANDEAAQLNFIRVLFQYYTKQSIDAYGESTLRRLHHAFADQDYNLQELLVEIVKIVLDP